MKKCCARRAVASECATYGRACNPCNQGGGFDWSRSVAIVPPKVNQVPVFNFCKFYGAKAFLKAGVLFVEVDVSFPRELGEAVFTLLGGAVLAASLCVAVGVSDSVSSRGGHCPAFCRSSSADTNAHHSSAHHRICRGGNAAPNKGGTASLPFIRHESSCAGFGRIACRSL